MGAALPAAEAARGQRWNVGEPSVGIVTAGNVAFIASIRDVEWEVVRAAIYVLAIAPHHTVASALRGRVARIAGPRYDLRVDSGRHLSAHALRCGRALARRLRPAIPLSPSTLAPSISVKRAKQGNFVETFMCCFLDVSVTTHQRACASSAPRASSAGVALRPPPQDLVQAKPD